MHAQVSVGGGVYAGGLVNVRVGVNANFCKKAIGWYIFIDISLILIEFCLFVLIYIFFGGF